MNKEKERERRKGRWDTTCAGTCGGGEGEDPWKDSNLRGKNEGNKIQMLSKV